MLLKAVSSRSEIEQRFVGSRRHYRRARVSILVDAGPGNTTRNSFVVDATELIRNPLSHFVLCGTWLVSVIAVQLFFHTYVMLLYP